MGKKFENLTENHISFIENQNIFFVATAGSEGRVNLSPKGMDTFRVIDENKIAWLNLTGSGNETAAHVLEKNRMTIMFCAFDGKPLILRLFGQAQMIYQDNSEWKKYISLFPSIAGSRQIFIVDVDLVQTSCGMSVPYFDFKSERSDLNKWAEKQGKEKIKDYWQTKNKVSLDNKPTGI